MIALSSLYLSIFLKWLWVKSLVRPGWYPKIAGIYGCFLRFLSSDDAGMGQNQLGASAVEPGDPVGGGWGDLWAGHSRESWVFVGCLANCLLRFCGLSSTNYQKYPFTKHLTNSMAHQRVGIYAINADFKWQPCEMYLGHSLYWQHPWPPTHQNWIIPLDRLKILWNFKQQNDAWDKDGHITDRHAQKNIVIVMVGDEPLLNHTSTP